MTAEQKYKEVQESVNTLRMERISLQEQRKTLLLKDDYNPDDLDRLVKALNKVNNQLQKESKRLNASERQAYFEKTGYRRVR